MRSVPHGHVLLALVFSVLASAAWSQTFLKTIGEPGRNEKGFVLHRTPSNELFIGGSVGDSAMVQRIDDNGNVLWSRSFRPPGVFAKHVFNLNSAPDGTLIGVGNGFNANGELKEGFHFRMDVDGNVFWVRNWDNPEVYEREMIALSATEYVLFANIFELGTPTSSDLIPARIDATTGDLNWLSPRLDLVAAVPFVDEVHAVTTIDQSHYVTSRIHTAGAPYDGIRAGLSKFTYDGQHLWTKYLLFPNNVSRRIYPTDIIASNDSLVVAYSGDINGISTNWTLGLIRVDTLGTVAWARDFNVAGSGQDMSTKIVATPFGYLVAGRTTNTSPPRLFMMAVSTSGALLWTKSYGDPAQEQALFNTYASNVVDVAGGFMMTGHVVQAGGDEDILLVRTDMDGNVVCSQVTPLNAITTVLPDQSFDTQIQEIPFVADLQNVPTVIEDAGIEDICVLDVALGNDTALCGNLTLDAGIPNAIYEWQDGSTLQTLEVTESGTYWVHVTVDCCVASDTIEVDLGALAGVDLGPDTVLCDGADIIFSPPTGTWTFLWSDGTTDAELFVNAPGTYWVEATDGSCVATDSVVVGTLPVPTVDFGPDTTSCDGNGILLQPAVTDADTYLWSDGSTGTELQVDVSGTITLDVGNMCGSATDAVVVTILETVDLDIGPDTILCTGTSFEITVDVPGWALTWSDGTTGNSLAIYGEGVYWLDVSQNNCTVSDTIAVTELGIPVLDLGVDTVVCNGEDLILAPVLVDVDDVLWSDGSTGEELLVDTTGTYTITGTNVCGSATDGIDVTVVEPLAISLGPDTLLCGTDSLVIDLSASGADLVWQDGSVDPEFTITAPGTFWVDGDIQGCLASDTIVVDYTQLPVLDLGPDTILCTVPLYVLDAGPDGEDAQWQDGFVGPLYEATRTGQYTAVITNYCGTVSDTVRVSFAVPEVPIDDIELCPGTKVELDPQGEMVQTIWTTGDTARTITVGEGAYGYEAADIHGCLHADFVIVEISSLSDGTIYMPNAFTPNGDGMNEKFGVYGPEASDFEMVIFDRWGLEAYRSVDPYKPWDGTYSGQEAPQDVYNYTVTYKDRCNANNTLVTKRGHLTLLR